MRLRQFNPFGNRSATVSGPAPGLAGTLKLLADTKNEAAEPVLAAALDAADTAIQHGALDALLERRSSTGQHAILTRLAAAGEAWREIIGQGRGRLTQALRDAILGSDISLSATACEAVLWFREYDLFPTLVLAAEDESHANASFAARTIVALADLLYEELSGPRDYSNRRDPQMVRMHVLNTLEASVRRYHKHHRVEAITAFVTLANRDHSALKQILIDPLHPVYLPVVDVLLHDSRAAIMRLLLGYLDDPHAPSAAITVLARRVDVKFVQHLLKKIGFEPAATACMNLKRVETIPWLKGKQSLLDTLDDAGQHSAIKLLLATNVKRAEVFAAIEHVLRTGTTGGRRTAAEALAAFQGAEANALAMFALGDEDPKVQATIAGQLRPRGIHGALAKLIELVDSRHQLVRKAACDSLQEFEFDRYQAAFDMLNDDTRRSTGVLVRKVHPESIAPLREELKSQSRTKRLRGLAMAVAMNVVHEVEEAVIALLDDDDHLVRSEAAQALGTSDTQRSRTALRGALFDRSVIVQEAAERSLEVLANKSIKPGLPLAGKPFKGGSTSGLPGGAR